jgi:hypothetical protein
MERYASRLHCVAYGITQNAADAREVVRRAILSDQYRTVLVLRDIEELSNEEVAEIVGESLAAVKSRLHPASMALREQLTKYFGRQPLDATSR